MFTRYEPLKVYMRAYPVTLFFILISIVVFICKLLFGEGASGDILYQFGAFSYESIQEGEWYRFITAIFLHSSWMHLLMNMVFIYVFSPFLEHRFGKVKFSLFFLLAGASSFVLPYFFHHNTLTAGASGAFYGLLALHLQLISKEPYRYSQGDRQTVVGMLIVGFILTFLTPHTSIFGHIGGFVFGWLWSYLFFIKPSKKKENL